MICIPRWNSHLTHKGRKPFFYLLDNVGVFRKFAHDIFQSIEKRADIVLKNAIRSKIYGPRQNCRRAAKMALREAEKDFYRQQIYVFVVQTLVYDIVFLI